MENYTITKEQILEIYGRTSVHNRGQLEEWFPEAFKKELEVGKWYVYNRCLLNYQGLSDKGIIQAYGFLKDKTWLETSNCWDDFKEWEEATNEEVEEALENEVIKRFGKHWGNAEIEECLVHGDTSSSYLIVITTEQIWNINGCIYRNGEFAEPLKAKVISLQEAEAVLSKKYGQKVEIK